MVKVIIHVGYPKTATTWFQNNFYPFVENFQYFNRELFKKHFLFGSENEFNEYSTKTFINTNHIICEEEIINIKKGLSVDNKAQRLKTNFKNPQIVIFIRNQFSILESKYSTYIQKGGTFTFEELINHLFISNKIKQWDYYSQIKIYIEIFGYNNVNIFLFEEFNHNRISFIERYIDTFNLKINVNRINYSPKNKSTNAVLLPFMREANKFSKNKIGFSRDTEKLYFHIPLFHIFSRTSFSILNHIPIKKRISSEKKLKKNTYNKVYQYFKDSNKKLITEFNLDIQKHNYPV